MKLLAEFGDCMPSCPRSPLTAQAIEYFIENSAAVAAPALTGALIVATGDRSFSILVICVTAWLICFLFYLGALFTIDKDTSLLRSQMEERAKTM